jgi:hypothetical protein
LGNTLKARCNVDTLSINIITFNDYVAEMNTDAIENPLLPRKRCVTPDYGLLNNNGAADSFHRTIEHRQEAITSIFDKPSVVLRDRRFNNFAPVPLHARVRSFFVVSHQAAIAGYVASHDRRKATRHSFRRIAIFAATEGIYLTAGVLSVAHGDNLRRSNFHNTPLFAANKGQRPLGAARAAYRGAPTGAPRHGAPMPPVMMFTGMTLWRLPGMYRRA